MIGLFRPLALWFALLGGAVGAGLALLTVVSVVGRAEASTPVQGDVELVQMSVAICISLCLPWCQLHGGNIIVDFFTQLMSERASHALDGVGALLLALMCALLSARTCLGRLLQRVYEQAKKAKLIHEIIIATDDERIEIHAKEFGATTIITSKRSRERNG